MERFTARARKYLFALGGVGLLILMQRLEISIPGLPDIVRDLLIGLVASEGVYQAANDPAKPDPMDEVQ